MLIRTYKMNRADGTPIKYHFWQRIKIRCYRIKASQWGSHLKVGELQALMNFCIKGRR